MTTVNDWLFAVATASVPILTFITVMYLLMRLHYVSEGLAKIEAAQIQLNRDFVELGKTVAALQAIVNKRD